jgi:hypothetical protein
MAKVISKARAKTPTKALAKTPNANAVAKQANALLKNAEAALGRAARNAPTPAGAFTGPDFVSELNNIDFQKMIAGPLQACVDAQVASSLATVNFINAVGFTTDASGKKELVMVDFSHSKTDFDAEGNEDKKETKIKVPLLAMLPIPSLRIDHVTIDFNVKLNSVQSSQVSNDFKLGVEAKAGWGPVNLKVSASYQRKSTTGMEIKKEYALNVNVKAVQDEMPAGLEKILNMLAA